MHELERPEPGCGEVLVRVVASAVNPVDAKLRADGGWAKLDPPVILGYDVAGIVEEVGPGISDFKIGDEVYYTPEIFGNPHGSYADYNVASAAIVARKPTGLSFVEASAIPLAGGTVWEGSPQVSGSARRNRSDSWRRRRGRFVCSSICQSRRGESSG
jgi:NADPH2:quinone reductase